MIGEVRYDEDGLPICEICGKSFKRVLSHVRQKHDMSEYEYKKTYGLDLYKGICSAESSALSRQRVYENKELCIDQNLKKYGKKTRFKKGSKGRTKEKISLQTKKRLQAHFKRLGELSRFRKNRGKDII